MGFLQQMKDLKATVAAAPAMIEQSQQLAANAQVMQAAYAVPALSTEMAAPLATAALPTEVLAPIHGVDLPTYAWVSKQVAHAGYDQSAAVGAAAQRGITSDQWQSAAEGWAARMQAVPALGLEFRRHFDAA